jgi:putative membrane protein
MKKLNSILWLAAMLFVAGACNDDDDDNMPSDQITDKDRTFVMSAADGGMFEVKAGEMAVAKGSATHVTHADSMSVKSFGQMMITDHTKANNELKMLADARGVAIPTTLTAAKQQKMDSLSAASGAAFDRMYTKMMVTSHQETINLFRSESNDGDNQELKSWASSKLPTLEHHLEMAEMMQDSIR